jgi:hypothetical protein
VFQISNAWPGASVVIDGAGTNFTWLFVGTGINAGAAIEWGSNSTTNGATHVTITNTAVVLRCVVTNRFSALYYHRRK